MHPLIGKRVNLRMMKGKIANFSPHKIQNMFFLFLDSHLRDSFEKHSGKTEEKILFTMAWFPQFNPLDILLIMTCSLWCNSTTDSCSQITNMTGWVLITLKSEDSMDRNVDIHHNERTDFSSLLRVTEVGFHQRVAMNLRQHPPTGHVSGSVRTQITARRPEHKPLLHYRAREGTQWNKVRKLTPSTLMEKTSIFCQATAMLVITGHDERREHSQKSAGQRDNSRSEERPVTI